MDNRIEYPIIQKGVDDSLENISTVLSVFDTDRCSYKSLYDNFSEQVIALISNGIEKPSAQKFHESLNTFEKFGFVSKEKIKLFEENTEMKKSIAAGAASFVLSIGPPLFGYVSNKLDMYNFQKFYISSLAYINRESTYRIKQNVARIFTPCKIKDKNYNKLFEKFGNENASIFELPSLKRSFYYKFNKMEKEQMKVFAGSILRACDWDDEEIRGRAEDYLDVYCKLSAPDIDRLIFNTKEQVDIFSDFIVFNSITAKDFFVALVNSIEKGQAYAGYNIDNDPYRKIRQKKAMLIGEGIKLAGDILGSKYKPIEVFADMSVNMFFNCIDTPSMEVAMKIEEARDKLKKEISCAGNVYGKE